MAEEDGKPVSRWDLVPQSELEDQERNLRRIMRFNEESMLDLLGATKLENSEEEATSKNPKLHSVDSRRRRRERMKYYRFICEGMHHRRRMTEKQKRQEDRCICPDNYINKWAKRRIFITTTWQVLGQMAQKESCCGDRWIHRWRPIVFDIDEVPEKPDPEPRREPRIPRHCMTKEEWLDFMSRPRDVRGCREDRTSACGTWFNHGRVKPLTLRLLELARPHPFRVQEAIKNAGELLDESRLRRLVEAAEQQSALTPEQAQEIVKMEDEHRKDMNMVRWYKKYHARQRKKELAKMKKKLAKIEKQSCRDRGDVSFDLGEVFKRLEGAPDSCSEDDEDTRPGRSRKRRHRRR